VRSSVDAHLGGGWLAHLAEMLSPESNADDGHGGTAFTKLLHHESPALRRKDPKDTTCLMPLAESFGNRCSKGCPFPFGNRTRFGASCL